MSNERLKTLLINSLIYMDTELVQVINPEENDIIKFLKDEIGFYDIPRLVRRAMDAVPFVSAPELEDVLKSDRAARIAVTEAM